MKHILILAIFAVSATLFADKSSQNSNSHYYYQDFSHTNKDEYHDAHSIGSNRLKNISPDNPYVSDQEIAKNLNAILKKGANANKFEFVFFELNNGNITLIGAVNTKAEKIKVEKIVREIQGVKIIKNQIEVKNENLSTKDPQSQLRLIAAQNFTEKINPTEIKNPDAAETESDRQLNVRIRNAIENGPFADKIIFLVLDTKNGLVTLKGQVRSMDDIREVLIEIKTVNGVKGIYNQLTAESR